MRARLDFRKLFDDGKAVDIRCLIWNETESREFHEDLKFDRKTFLPKRFVVVSPGGESTEDYTPKDLKVNTPVEPSTFLKEPPAGWEVKRMPASLLALFPRLFPPSSD